MPGIDQALHQSHLDRINAPPAPIIHLSRSTLPELLNSPHVWLLNVCRLSCGFCQGLTPAWEAVALRLRQEIHVAYWDAELHGRPPAILGEVNATPTIRAFVPRALFDGPAQQVDYEGDRSSADLTHFARALVPDLVEPVVDEVAWARLEERAATKRLPRLLLFSGRPANATTPPILRAVSSAFATRALIAEVRLHPTAPGTAALASGAYFAPPSKLPAACVIPHRDASMSCLHDAPTYARLASLIEEGIAVAQDTSGPPGGSALGSDGKGGPEGAQSPESGSVRGLKDDL